VERAGGFVVETAIKEEKESYRKFRSAIIQNRLHRRANEVDFWK
jgi:hypothetical protein